MIKIKNRIVNINIPKDRAIFLVCIIIALFFWLLIKLSQSYRSGKSIALHYELPEGKAFTKLPPDAIKATLGGRGWSLMYDFFLGERGNLTLQLPDEDFAEISNAQLRERISELITQNLQIEQLNIDNIRINLEENVSKMIPVVLNHELSFADEHHLTDSILLSPDSITLSGAASIVEGIIVWPSEKLVLNDLKSDVSIAVKLEAPTPVLEFSPEEVQVQIPVEQFTEKPMFVPITVKNAKDSLKIFPGKIRLSCVVGLSRYNDISSRDFEVEVDLKDMPLAPENNTVPITLTRSPEKVFNIKFSPKSVEFFIVQEKDLIE
ncbi:MAG: hypothetical protein GY705_15510 [Bacteroidetes bacterium]|nr:hypothetical protein [Bacteroidota bacterium]